MSKWVARWPRVALRCDGTISCFCKFLHTLIVSSDSSLIREEVSPCSNNAFRNPLSKPMLWATIVVC